MGCFLVEIVIFGLLSSFLTFPVAARREEGCPDKCGTVTIPYPFGIGDGCSLNTEFEILCDNSTDPPKAYVSNFEVTELEIDGRMTILHSKVEECQENNDNSQSSLLWVTNDTTLNETFPMFFFGSKNKLIGIGCSALASISGRNYADQTHNYYSLDCRSTCENPDAADKKSCSDNGCCAIDLPGKLIEINFAASWFPEDNSRFFSQWPCSYAFIVDGNIFNFSLMFNKSIPMKFPFAMDWSVNDDPWLLKKQNSSIKICRDNALSYKVDYIPGMRCRCREGFGGNPYLGCQDIDECKHKDSNDCIHGCKNEIGSFTCSCPKFYRGDGKKNSQGCVFHLPIAIIAVIIICSIILVIPSLILVGQRIFKFVKKIQENMLKKEFFIRNGGLLLEQQMISGDENQMQTKLFISKELEKATDNYNENRILGQGGQGTVYKGMLEDGRLVAIKKSKLISERQVKQFINELVILHQINHRNVVKLLGCCLETKVPMLVYEYIPNGMLSQYLHDQSDDLPLTWNMRLRIAVEVADALYYLHSAASNPIYHCDIKSANILMDETYAAKVADFGIARSIDIDQTHVTTPNIQGTLGYLDPEYFRTGQFTEKSDAYSFGVVLVELLTNYKPISSARAEYEGSLVNYFIHVMEEHRLFDIVDSSVAKGGSNEAIIAFAELAKRCLDMTGRNRPTMREVASELNRIRKSQDVMNLQNEEGVGVHNGIREVGSTSMMSFGNLDAQDFLTIPRE